MLNIETPEEYERLQVLAVMLRLWVQLESEWCDSTARHFQGRMLHHWCMRGQEDAGWMLENEGFVKDDGDSFNITELGLELLKRFE